VQVKTLGAGLARDPLQQQFTGGLTHLKARRDHAGDARRGRLADIQTVKTR